MSAPDRDQPLPGTAHSTDASCPPVVCSRCGRPIASAAPKLGCLVCLLTDGLDGDTVEETPAPAPAGERFGDFALEHDPDGSPRELGHGAMGTTYLARDTVLDRPVALKVINAAATIRSGARARFLREAKAAAALRHPNVAGIFQYGVREADGQPFYAMEFIEGETLEERVRRAGPLPVALALEIATQIARALGAAEARGLVHRDLKPSNVMLANEDAGHAGEPLVKVIDFGLAKTVLAAGSTRPAASQSADGFVGTPAFASPEQFAVTAPDPGRQDASVVGGELDVRSDIFSLGVTLWYLLTGTVPFMGRTLAEIHERQTRHPLPVEQLAKAAVPAPVITLLRSLLAPDPAARPQHARELAAALRDCRQALAAPFRKRRAWVLGGVAAALLGLGAVFLVRRSAVSPAPPAAVEKSIAVLPFTNLGGDPANAFLADGMQDEILTDLARVADLKVISRTSVMAYHDAPRSNVRDIGRDLGVAYVLEGSVAREGSHLRVTAQLIDARTDAHVWAERYDRPVDSLFTIQDEVAGQIAARLQVHLGGGAAGAAGAPPTTDLPAYELYLKATDLYTGYQETRNPRETLEQATRLLDEATRRDPRFYRAYCLLSNVHITLYKRHLDFSPTRLALALDALANAQRLRPDAGETHYAAALLASWKVPRDHAREASELALARERLPNDPLVFWLSGMIANTTGDWEESRRSLERSILLDPRNSAPLYDLGNFYNGFRRYDDQRRIIARSLALHKDPFYWQNELADTFLDERADPGPVLAVFAPMPPGLEPFAGATLARFRTLCMARDFPAAKRVLDGSPALSFTSGDNLTFPRAWFEGLLARYEGNESAARQAFNSARATVLATAPLDPADFASLDLHAQIDAAVGRKAEALREAQGAYELEAKNTYWSARTLVILAQVEAWTGETDAALGHLTEAARRPYGPSYGDLRLMPDWDALRGDPRFEALCRELAPAAK